MSVKKPIKKGPIASQANLDSKAEHFKNKSAPGKKRPIEKLIERLNHLKNKRD